MKAGTRKAGTLGSGKRVPDKPVPGKPVPAVVVGYGTDTPSFVVVVNHGTDVTSPADAVDPRYPESVDHGTAHPSIAGTNPGYFGEQAPTLRHRRTRSSIYVRRPPPELLGTSLRPVAVVDSGPVAMFFVDTTPGIA